DVGAAAHHASGHGAEARPGEVGRGPVAELGGNLVPPGPDAGGRVEAAVAAGGDAQLAGIQISDRLLHRLAVGAGGLLVEIGAALPGGLDLLLQVGKRGHWAVSLRRADFKKPARSSVLC